MNTLPMNSLPMNSLPMNIPPMIFLVPRNFLGPHRTPSVARSVTYLPTLGQHSSP
jgi:hypothetical protein